MHGSKLIYHKTALIMSVPDRLSRQSSEGLWYLIYQHWKPSLINSMQCSSNIMYFTTKVCAPKVSESGACPQNFFRKQYCWFYGTNYMSTSFNQQFLIISGVAVQSPVGDVSVAILGIIIASLEHTKIESTGYACTKMWCLWISLCLIAQCN